jgi:subtilisin family serine protease
MSSVHVWGRRSAVAIALALLPSMLPGLPAHAAADAEGVVAGAGSPDAVPGRYIVVLDPDAGRLGEPAKALVGEQFTTAGTDDTFTTQLSASDARVLAADPAVEAVEQDRIVRTSAVQLNPVWGLDRIDQPGNRLSKTFTPMADGNSVHAYVLDTGIRIGHSQFGGRASYGHDFADDDRVASDCDGHGTHVAGTIGGRTYGVAKQVRLVAVRVMDCNGSGYLSDIIDGVNWVTGNAIRPAVANMSIGIANSPALDAAVQRSIDSGVTYVVAAGNSNVNARALSPARLPAAITVAATDTRDRRAYFSNWGASVDLFAPGVGIKSAGMGSTTATVVLSGTSMATPHVAGAAALVLDAFPAFRAAQVRAYLAARATRGRVVDRKNAPNLLLRVSGPPPAPVIATAKLPTGQAGQPYAAQLSLVAGRRGTWRLAAGTLPTGLTLSTTGLISGTPTTATTTRKLVVRFTDYVPQTASRILYIQVRA